MTDTDKMINIELIYDADCPNADNARSNLLHALQAAGVPPEWKEWVRSNPGTPPYARAFGSPTILVDGHDVADTTPSDGADSCRLYMDDGGGFGGVPSVETIVSALLKANGVGAATGNSKTRYGGWRSIPAVLPGISLTMLPNLTCPACWPAYAGLFGALGLGFVNYTPYLLPLTAVFMIPAVALLGFRAGKRRGYKPFVVGILAAVILVVGRFALDYEPAMYMGILLLMSASIWNSWPKKEEENEPCSNCITGKITLKQGMQSETERR